MERVRLVWNEDFGDATIKLIALDIASSGWRGAEVVGAWAGCGARQARAALKWLIKNRYVIAGR